MIDTLIVSVFTIGFSELILAPLLPIIMSLSEYIFGIGMDLSLTDYLLYYTYDAMFVVLPYSAMFAVMMYGPFRL